MWRLFADHLRADLGLRWPSEIHVLVNGEMLVISDKRVNLVHAFFTQDYENLGR